MSSLPRSAFARSRLLAEALSSLSHSHTIAPIRITTFRNCAAHTTRNLSHTSIIRAAKPLKSAKAPKAPKSVTPPPPVYQSYAAKLASSNSPTLLYLAPSHALFIGTAYAGAAFCLGYAAINYMSVVYYPPPDLSKWIPYAFTGVCFMVSCFGGYLLMAPMRVIRSITAVPARAKVVAKAAAPSAKAAGETVTTRAGKGAVAAKAATPAVPAEQEGEIMLELKLRRMLPILPAKVVTVPPSACTLNMPMYYPLSALTPAQRHAMEQRNEALKRAEQEEERKKSILTAPFRHLSKALYALMKNTQRIWTREGFLEIKIGQKTYKLDISGGWALDEGRALDRLIKSPRS